MEKRFELKQNARETRLLAKYNYDHIECAEKREHQKAQDITNATPLNRVFNARINERNCKKD